MTVGLRATRVKVIVGEPLRLWVIVGQPEAEYDSPFTLGIRVTVGHPEGEGDIPFSLRLRVAVTHPEGEGDSPFSLRLRVAVAHPEGDFPLSLRLWVTVGLPEVDTQFAPKTANPRKKKHHVRIMADKGGRPWECVKWKWWKGMGTLTKCCQRPTE